MSAHPEMHPEMHQDRPAMVEAEFAALLAGHGAAPALWPAARRGAALALLERSAEARRRHLDAALAESLPPPDAATLARMQARLAARIARSPRPAPRGRLDWLR
ncbi:hypothetical protein NON00_23530, partial [Roseomonas sp. GC11]|nr:hypothetical protein [Roseomonas sp. GC11]